MHIITKYFCEILSLVCLLCSSNCFHHSISLEINIYIFPSRDFLYVHLSAAFLFPNILLTFIWNTKISRLRSSGMWAKLKRNLLLPSSGHITKNLCISFSRRLLSTELLTVTFHEIVLLIQPRGPQKQTCSCPVILISLLVRERHDSRLCASHSHAFHYRHPTLTNGMEQKRRYV